MNVEELTSKIFDLTKNKEIFVEEKKHELKIWSAFGDSKLYNIFIGFRLTNSVAKVQNYVIDYNLRGIGIGSKFFDIIEEYLKSCGYKEIQLHLVATSAEKFWSKKRFTIQNNVWRKEL